MAETTQTNQPKYTIEPYTGVGSGVLKHGTIILEGYDGPASVVGHFNEETVAKFPGTWVIREAGNDQK